MTVMTGRRYRRGRITVALVATLLAMLVSTVVWRGARDDDARAAALTVSRTQAVDRVLYSPVELSPKLLQPPRPDPYRAVVATVRPEITLVDTFDAPGGTLVSFDFPITNPTFFGSAQTFVVIDRDPSGQWLEVQLPVRPNHSTAWILASSVELSAHRFHGVVDVSDRLVRFFDGETVLSETTVVVGGDATPTPLGQFYINEILPQANPGGAYGPFIFGLSAFSETLETFSGGIPVIALHGTNHPEWVGQARSNGCVRMPNEIADQLAALLPAGTPVEIVA